jgi:hypothetical protein
MDLLAYWRFDNYHRDLDEGAGFHFNSKQSRLHSAMKVGDTLWLFTRLIGQSGHSEFRIVAKLVIRAKTINPPTYKYGPFRIWGDLQASQYYRVRLNKMDDAFELLRLTPLDSGSFKGCERTNLAQAAQTIRGLKPEASKLLDAFCEQMPIETRAKAVADEAKLEKAYAGDLDQLQLILREEHIGVSDEKKAELLGSYSRNRQLVADLNEFYAGRCQLCGFDSPSVYSVESAEAHHVIYRSRGGPDEMENLVLLCPTHHTVVHRADATFDYARLHFIFSNGRVEPLGINKHLKSRVLN